MSSCKHSISLSGALSLSFFPSIDFAGETNGLIDLSHTGVEVQKVSRCLYSGGTQRCNAKDLNEHRAQFTELFRCLSALFK